MGVSYTFSDAEIIDPDEVNTNFADVMDQLSNITAADISTSAGIVSTQLADRFATYSETILITPYYNHLATPAVVLANSYIPDSNSPGVEVWRKYMTLRSGRSCALCSVSVHARDITLDGADAPAVFITRNGTVISGGVPVAADNFVYHLRNSNPVDNPLTSLAHDDYISINLGVLDATTGNAASSAITQAKGLSVTLTYKVELTS